MVEMRRYLAQVGIHKKTLDGVDCNVARQRR